MITNHMIKPLFYLTIQCINDLEKDNIIYYPWRMLRGCPWKTSAARGVQCRIFRTKGEGFLQMQKSTHFDAKHIGCFEIYGVSAVRTRGSIFRDFERTFFTYSPLLDFFQDEIWF